MALEHVRLRLVVLSNRVIPISNASEHMVEAGQIPKVEQVEMTCCLEATEQSVISMRNEAV